MLWFTGMKKTFKPITSCPQLSVLVSFPSCQLQVHDGFELRCIPLKVTRSTIRCKNIHTFWRFAAFGHVWTVTLVLYCHFTRETNTEWSITVKGKVNHGFNTLTCQNLKSVLYQNLYHIIWRDVTFHNKWTDKMSVRTQQFYKFCAFLLHTDRYIYRVFPWTISKNLLNVARSSSDLNSCSIQPQKRKPV